MAKRTLMWAIAAWCGLASGGLAACGRSSDVTGVAEGGPPIDLTPENAVFTPCAEKSSSATLVPVSLFFAVDKSGSMGMKASMTSTDTKWNELKAAFTTFFSDPSAASLQVAMRFWPDATCGGPMDMPPVAMTCDTQACSVPSVNLGLLSDAMHRAALNNAINAITPSNGTPMSAALAGAELWAANRQKMAPGEKVIVVLVTDGQATACDNNLQNIAKLAGDANKQSGILTYAIGFPGSNEMDMNAIAAAGGTDKGFFLADANTGKDFLAALLKIAGTAAACTLAVPADEKLSPKLVRVVYTAGGTTPNQIGRVDGPMACANGGWYYDNPDKPSSITLCPSTCTQVQKDGKATLEFKMGCKCQTDADCPAGNVCSTLGCVAPCTPGVNCLQQAEQGDGSVALQPDEAVQGGSLTCSAGPSGSRGATMWWWGTLAAVLIARRRRAMRR
jgi:hypothetical protein